MIMLKPIFNIRMLLLALIVISISQTGTSQIVIDSKFKPFSYEELMMQAQPEAAYNSDLNNIKTRLIADTTSRIGTDS